MRCDQEERDALRYDNPMRQRAVQVSWWRIYRPPICRGARKGLGKPEIGPVEAREVIGLI